MFKKKKLTKVPAFKFQLVGFIIPVCTKPTALNRFGVERSTLPCTEKLIHIPNVYQNQTVKCQEGSELCVGVVCQEQVSGKL